jgi:hypothetical protein
MKIDWEKITIRKLASIIASCLKEESIDALLVGGACVTIYSKNRYVSGDLDFVSHASLKAIGQALSGIGFIRQGSRHFIREGCPFFVEFVAPPPAVGNEPIKAIEEIRTATGVIRLLTPTDTVKDRLAAFYHWNDPQALQQAILVARLHHVNFKELKRWSLKEGHEIKYRRFLEALKPISGP